MERMRSVSSLQTMSRSAEWIERTAYGRRVYGCRRGLRRVDAVENCKLYHPDLVLLDIKMPFLDGLAAAKIIYEEELADTIIMLTAYSEREFVEQAKDYGVSGYLVKPIDEKSLIPNIELVVAQSKEMKRLRKDMAKVSERWPTAASLKKPRDR